MCEPICYYQLAAFTPTRHRAAQRAILLPYGGKRLAEQTPPFIMTDPNMEIAEDNFCGERAVISCVGALPQLNELTYQHCNRKR